MNLRINNQVKVKVSSLVTKTLWNNFTGGVNLRFSWSVLFFFFCNACQKHEAFLIHRVSYFKDVSFQVRFLVKIVVVCYFLFFVFFFGEIDKLDFWILIFFVFFLFLKIWQQQPAAAGKITQKTIKPKRKQSWRHKRRRKKSVWVCKKRPRK